MINKKMGTIIVVMVPVIIGILITKIKMIINKKLEISLLSRALYKLISPFITTIYFVLGLTFVLGLGFQFILYGIIEASLQILDSSTNANTNKEWHLSILLIIVAAISQFICHFTKETLQCFIHTATVNTYVEEQFKRYMKLDTDSRNTYVATSFYSELKDLLFNIANLAIYGVFKLASLVENIVMIIIVFCFRGYSKYLVGLLIGHTVWFYIFTKPKFKEWKTVRTIYREKMAISEANVQILLPEFQQQREGLKNIVDNIINASHATYCGALVFCKFLMMTHIATYLSIIIFVIYWFVIGGTPADLLVLIQLITKLNVSITQIVELYAQFAKVETSFVKYENHWRDLIE